MKFIHNCGLQVNTKENVDEKRKKNTEHVNQSRNRWEKEKKCWWEGQSEVLMIDNFDNTYRKTKEMKG